MNQAVLSQTDLAFLPIVALFIFFAILLGAFVLVLRPGAKKHYDARRYMALADDISPSEPEVQRV